MLGRVIGDHWHALVRDVLALGYRTDDMFTTLSVAEMVAIVAAAPPHSSLRWFMDGQWSRTDQLLANMQEQNAGLATLPQPYERPGLEERPTAQGSNKLFNADAKDWDEFTELESKRAAYAADMAARGVKPTNSRTKVWGAQGVKSDSALGAR